MDKEYHIAILTELLKESKDPQLGVMKFFESFISEEVSSRVIYAGDIDESLKAALSIDKLWREISYEVNSTDVGSEYSIDLTRRVGLDPEAITSFFHDVDKRLYLALLFVYLFNSTEVFGDERQKLWKGGSLL